MLEELPPQPVLMIERLSMISPKVATDQKLRDVSFLRKKKSGNSRNGNKMFAVAVVVTVCAKTTVIQ